MLNLVYPAGSGRWFSCRSGQARRHKAGPEAARGIEHGIPFKSGPIGGFATEKRRTKPGTGRRAGLSVLYRLKLVDQLVDYAIAKLVAHCHRSCAPEHTWPLYPALVRRSIADHASQ